MKNVQITVIIPTYNERENIDTLVERLTAALSQNDSIETYELLFIDDHSTDGTFEYLDKKQQTHPCIRAFLKRGKMGKSWSILEGLDRARFDILAMIDADLQYPPEKIPEMVKMLSEKVDIVVANRVCFHTSKQRKFLSKTFNFLFGKIFFGMDADMQSGLKVFKKEVFHNLFLNPTKWGFDYEFLFKAQRMCWRISNVDIEFTDRRAGVSKVRIMHTGLELFWGAIKLRTRYLLRSIFSFADYPHYSEARPNNFKNSEDFLFLPEIYSAKKHFYYETISFLFFCIFLLILYLFFWHIVLGSAFLVILSGSLAFCYFVFMVFKIWVVFTAIKKDPTTIIQEKDLEALQDEDLPVYTIIIPLYREEKVIPQIIEAMSAIDYPSEKLDLIITLEEYDYPTMHAIAEANPPAHFRTLILPNVTPKTKPKALNVAFLQARGEFLVIYDAEIIPDPDQLKKAAVAFQKHPGIACFQTRLDHYNPRQSFITRMFNSEFSFHYDFFLPGLQKLHFPLPLSGHSTHFRMEALKNIGAWDPYNVTEDCDMGMRLYRAGYLAGMINSTSKEEATITFKAWVLQRTRWMKGFIQTSIVHLRHPFRFKKEIGGFLPFLGFLFIVPGSVLVNIINFLSWGILLLWLTLHPRFIQDLFPLPVLYLSVLSFFVGNFFLTYMNLVAVYRRRRYDLVKYNLLSFVYWIMLAFSAARAVIEFITRPHHWEKTVHGVHLAGNKRRESFPRSDFKFETFSAKETSTLK